MAAWRTVAALAGSLLATSPGHAADRAVRLATPRPLGHLLAAMPTIAAPADAAEHRINAALHRLDARLRRDRAGCKDWQRTVEPTLRGPGFLAFLVVDFMECGGPHPEQSTTAVVYDLRTGQLADWATLLPPSLAGRPILAADPLYDLYLARYPATIDPADQAECSRTIQFMMSPPRPRLVAWPDAKVRGLTILLALPHVAVPCERAITIPIAELMATGASPRLVAALEAAR